VHGFPVLPDRSSPGDYYGGSVALVLTQTRG
jgi:hypothetical protein